MCYYERPTFLPLIVSNLKSQTFVQKYPTNVEFILCDDSLPTYNIDIDQLKQDLKGVIDDITYIHVPHTEKLTIGQKRNMLCERAKHSILIFMDDDDYYFPSYVEYSVFELCKRRKALVGSNSMLFCYVYENFKQLSINCMSPRQIHEATMCMLKSHWQYTGGFAVKGNGEGAKLIDGHETKVNAKLDINKLMACVVHKKNSCNKAMFLNLASPATYPLSEDLKKLIQSCTDHPLFLSRVRICFKYASRERPEQFKRCMQLYTDMLSGVHDCHFVISMDTNDTTMNNDDIKSFLTGLRKRYQIEYYYGESKNKIDAINRDMIAPTFDILLLISDDMIPQIHCFDQVIVNDFKTHFPDFDGMLNYNDGLRNDWPLICTLTVYGYNYFKRFGYIYNASYTSVYCDNEQTEVGRMLGRLKDIDNVIIKHEWNNPLFQDELRQRTEKNDIYLIDHDVYKSRKAKHFDLRVAGDVVTTPPPQQNIQQSVPAPTIGVPKGALLTINVICRDPNTLQRCMSEIEQRILKHKDKILLNGFCLASMNVSSYLFFHRLSMLTETPFTTFYFENEKLDETYAEQVCQCISSHVSYDIITFNQKCSMNGGQTSFILESRAENPNEEIPSTGPWKEVYKRSVTNWSLFNTNLFKTITMPQEENELIKQLMSMVKQVHAIDKVLYSWTI